MDTPEFKAAQGEIMASATPTNEVAAIRVYEVGDENGSYYLLELCLSARVHRAE